ncbi:MAG: Rrf2 family transcriptional regulator [Armatimonadota bacterium]|nr:Rrf2 family transcriptional regulator [Armatimonadota bacterium]MDR7451463.1 Rrf2 family transcriptional regulator [Armatimonadota bacterium]MDR7466387.1 Rrf2 family transcriptional regulator [Armatimonadota bacterium]MDR7493109.1 Rrf2 family transcriptional regulator [Armatimonadota bacterium]MDR7498134.1 Rrf2 family transcriptional regulator [Armatimonadota bacterium]
MEITRQADYAIRIVLDLAATDSGGVVRSDDVARRQLVPRAYFTKVVQTLVRAGYVRTLRGARGGIQLARDPQTITLRQIIEAAEGPIRLNRCVAGGECALERTCSAHPVWEHIQGVLMRELDSATVAQMVAGDRRSRRARRRAS